MIYYTVYIYQISSIYYTSFSILHYLIYLFQYYLSHIIHFILQVLKLSKSTFMCTYSTVHKAERKKAFEISSTHLLKKDSNLKKSPNTNLGKFIIIFSL